MFSHWGKKGYNLGKASATIGAVGESESEHLSEHAPPTFFQMLAFLVFS